MTEDGGTFPDVDGEKVQKLLEIIEINHRLQRMYRQEITELQGKIAESERQILYYKQHLPTEERMNLLFGV